jgi:CRP-like cAMP-binding protein
MPSERVELLKNMPIFGGLSADALGLILELSRSVVVPEGDFFFRQGDEGKSAFILERGQVSVVKLWESCEYLLRPLGAGDCFGEMALIDFGLRSATVRAEVESAAIEMSPNCLLKVAKHDLEQYTMIYMNMARELSRRLREADERLFKAKVEQRIADDEFDFSSG